MENPSNAILTITGIFMFSFVSFAISRFITWDHWTFEAINDMSGMTALISFSMLIGYFIRLQENEEAAKTALKEAEEG